jgi:hypothetical protein
MTEANANVIGDSHRVHKHSKCKYHTIVATISTCSKLKIVTYLPPFLTKLCLIVYFVFQYVLLKFSAKVTRSINDNFQLVPHFMLVFVELYIFYTNKSRLPSRYIFYQLVEL